jgi:asparagine synthase (glutamine-hydrolysing)
MDHLELDDWVRLDWCDELDMLGPVATRVLARHGILVPFNSHFHYPLLELAAGGSLLTGFGGDELFGRVERVALADVMFSPRRLRVGELPSLVIDIAPRPVRTLVRGLRRPYRHFSWIRLPALASLGWADTSWDMREPVRWDRSVCEWWWPARMLQCCLASMRVMAADFDVHVASPLASSVVLAAFAQAGGAVGLRSRSPALRGILGDLLPETVLSRATKASFGGAFWSRHARDFVARWDGRGIDQTRVSAAALRKEWALPSPDAHSFVQLQRAWMASRPCTAGK